MDKNFEVLPKLLELLYEVLAYPERWRDFLSELCRHLTCNVVVSFHDWENRNPVIRFCLGLSDQVVQEWNVYYGSRNPRAPDFLREVRQRGSILSAASIADAPAPVRDSEYGHWMRQLDICHSVIAAVPVGLETLASLSLVRPQSAGTFELGAVELVRMLIPHLQRVFQIQGKLETLHAYSEAGKLALDRLDAGFLAVDAMGRVVLMNDQAEAILRTGHGITMRDGRLAATDSIASGPARRSGEGVGSRRRWWQWWHYFGAR